MSVLQDMTKGITGQKAAKASKLTPVAGETSTTIEQMAAALIPDVPGGVFLAAEAVHDIAKDLRAQAATLIAVADGLDKYKPDYLKEPEAPPKVGKVEARLAGSDPEPEVTPVEKFAEDFAAKAAAAQAAVFTSLDDGAAEDEPTPATGGWVCPEHGAAVRELTSRKGRKYLACTLCDEFEKE